MSSVVRNMQYARDDITLIQNSTTYTNRNDRDGVPDRKTGSVHMSGSAVIRGCNCSSSDRRRRPRCGTEHAWSGNSDRCNVLKHNTRIVQFYYIVKYYKIINKAYVIQFGKFDVTQRGHIITIKSSLIYVRYDEQVRV